MGRIAPRTDAAATARVIFAIYQAELRDWLMRDAPDPEQGLAALGRALNVAVEGITR
jgi:hypothetical protein